MAEDWGDIPCSVEQFWDMLNKLDSPQKQRIITFGLGCMLHIRCIKMRPALLKFLINKYNVRYKNFVIAPKQSFGITYADVEDIFGLKRNGRVIKPDESLTVQALPKQFQRYSNRNGFNIKSLIADIEMYTTPDEDFLRRFVLVMIGTIIAPVSKEYIPISYFSMVHDVQILKKINWNVFTLDFLKASLAKVLEGLRPSHWPSGNLALLQYAYWEKLRPVGFDFGPRVYPLMRRWDEKRAYMRDQNDHMNGRDSGLIIHDLRQDDINYQSNSDDDEEDFRTPDSKRNSTYEGSQQKTSLRLSSVEKGLFDVKKGISSLEKGMSKMKRHIRHMPSLIRRLERFFDKEAESDATDRNTDNSDDFSSPLDTSQSSAQSQDSNGSDKVITADALDDDVIVLSDGVQKIDEVTSGDELGDTVADRVKETKRKRKTPSSLRSPMMIFKNEKRKRTMEASSSSIVKKKQAENTGTTNSKKTRATRASQASKQKMKKVHNRQVRGPNKNGMDASSHREAAVAQYVNNLCSSKSTNADAVYKSGFVDVYANDMKEVIIDSDLDSAKYVSNNIIDAYACHLALGIKDSRRFCRVWEGWLMSKSENVDDCLSPDERSNHDDFANRFFEHELVFFPLNLQRGRHEHWIVVVMNVKKKKFQILDALWNLDMYMDQVLELRDGIQRMTTFARKKFPELPKRVDTWEITFIKNLPMQTDGHSCGLFALKFMESWNDTKLDEQFTQEDVSILRRKLPAEIIFSPTNELQEVREEVEKIMQEAEKISQQRNPPQK